jgi:hypothetical protein
LHNGNINDPNSARALADYAFSIGANRMNHSGCITNENPTNAGLNLLNIPTSNHGNAEPLRNISGVFSRRPYAARFRDITDGTSEVIAIGEILPQHCNWQLNGWFWQDSPYGHTGWPLNQPVRDPWGEAALPASVIGDLQGPGITCPYNDRSRGRITSAGFRSEHPGIVQFVFCDGSVHPIPDTIDYMTYQKLGDRRDGEPVGEF